jgi:hypothetical protein
MSATKEECRVFASTPVCGARLTQFRAVLASAARTRYYRSRLEQAGLGEAARIAEIEDAEEVLGLLPRSELSGILEDFESLRDPLGERSEPRDLCYPLDTPPRTAVLFPGFHETRHVRVFADNWSRKLKRYRPNAIAGPAGVLRALALGIRDSRVATAPLTHAVVVFTGIEHGILRQADRDLFWQIFQVPLFEQLRGLGGELLAVECEAHHGLHICSTDSVLEMVEGASGSELVYTSLTSMEYPLVRLATGLAGDLHKVACECGDATPRLTGLLRLPRSQGRAMSAAAEC